VECTLIQDGAPNLLPMQGRSPCIHVSDVIRDICIATGQFDGDREMNMAQMQLGRALEYAIISMVALDDPDRYIQPGEVMVDGLPGTPDLFDVIDYLPHEIKCTWMTTKWAPGSEKFWKYEVQLKAYAYMLGACKGRLHVCYINGAAYPKRGERRDEFPYAPEYKVWEYTWSKSELAENWLMLLGRRDSMKLEQER
jgi:hypothetical protein